MANESGKKAIIAEWIYRILLSAAIGSILYLQQNYVTHREFEEYKKGHENWAAQVITGMEAKSNNKAELDDIRRRLERIERLLDSRPAMRAPLQNNRP